MKVTEKLLKPVKETRYLTAENADRYRVIMRLFYQKYEKLKYWLYQEDVLGELTSDQYFSEYTADQCQQDLKMLEAWGNLVTMQDTKSVATIEEFKNRKFRYQMSEYAVEIERLVTKLENLFIEGASLEPVLLERIRISLSKMEEVAAWEEEKVYSWWNDLNNDFIRLNQNYQDYMRELNSLKAEELMQTKAFLLYKDRLVEYLRSFVKSLQLNVGMIEEHIRRIGKETLQVIFEKVLSYEMNIPRLEIEVNEEQIRDKITGRFESLKEWFVSSEGHDTEASKIFDTTNEVIRRITRYAMRISERGNSSANRREEYYKVAEMFHKCEDINEAHRLSAMVFGVEAPMHLQGNFARTTESINSGVYEEEPAVVTLTPRIRTYREKADRSQIIDRTAEKEEMRQRSLKKIEEERAIVNSYIKEGVLDFSTLPTIEPEIREVFLQWLSKALENSRRRGRTEEGRIYHVDEAREKTMCTIHCTDGEFQMPSLKLVFEE